MWPEFLHRDTEVGDSNSFAPGHSSGGAWGVFTLLWGSQQSCLFFRINCRCLHMAFKDFSSPSQTYMAVVLKNPQPPSRKSWGKKTWVVKALLPARLFAQAAFNPPDNLEGTHRTVLLLLQSPSSLPSGFFLGCLPSPSPCTLCYLSGAITPDVPPASGKECWANPAGSPHTAGIWPLHIAVQSQKTQGQLSPPRTRPCQWQFFVEETVIRTAPMWIHFILMR